MQNTVTEKFSDVVSKITDIGKAWHSDDIVNNAYANLASEQKNLKQLPPITGKKAKSAIVISAGPSLHKFKVIHKLKEQNYQGSIIAVDGSLVKCLKQGLVPDYVLTLDPHPTRIVRWFGDDNFEENTKHDDYFSRQDLDVDFRNNSIRENQANIELVNKYANQIKLIICSSAPTNVTTRALAAGFDMYWWNPIVDKPQDPNSLTRKIYQINNYPCMNTGGTVGTAAWVFADAILGMKQIGITGMDLGYHTETPYHMTQTYYELHEFIEDESELAGLFPQFTFPLTGETFYTDPTYYWYRKNFLDLFTLSQSKTYNCSEAGTLFSEKLNCCTLDDFLART